MNRSPAEGERSPIEQIFAPFREFASSSAASGVLLMAAAVIALVWANSPAASSYERRRIPHPARDRERPKELKAMYSGHVMDVQETKNVGLGRTSLVVAASDGPGG